MRVELDLRWPLEEAIAVNEAGARFDGVERIDADGNGDPDRRDGRHAQARARLRRAGASPLKAAGAAAELKRASSATRPPHRAQV